MPEHLISLCRTMGAPSYVEQEPYMNLNALRPSNAIQEPIADENFDRSTLQNVNIMGEWPAVQDSLLDSSQMAAVRRILSKKVAVVQGPPGTGMQVFYFD